MSDIEKKQKFAISQVGYWVRQAMSIGVTYDQLCDVVDEERIKGEADGD